MGHEISHVCLVYISHSFLYKLQNIHHISPIDFYSNNANVRAQKSLKRTCPSFDFECLCMNVQCI